MNHHHGDMDDGVMIEARSRYCSKTWTWPSCIHRDWSVLCCQVLPVINEHGRTRIEANVTVKSNFSSALFALNVVVTVPVPGNTSKAHTMVSR